jgi:hypothetical protein
MKVVPSRWLVDRRPWALALSWACAAVLSGCGGNDNAAARSATYPVSGSIVLPDGKPMTSGTVYLVPKEKSTVGATGKIGSDGTFKLSTYGTDDGAAEGTYKVRIEPVYDDLAKGKKGAPKMPYSTRFTDEDTSGLTAEVKPQDNKLPPFQLDNKSTTVASQGKDRGD